MSFTQTKFLNSSIRSFSASIGWNGQESSLSVSLVDDPANSDSFTKPAAGNPSLFIYESFNFGGLIQSYSENRSESGRSTYEVTLTSPTVVIEGTELILDNYNGLVFDVPNTLNIFGHIENADGFGAAEVNDSGMKWKKVRDTITTITSLTTAGDYGGPILYQNSTYRVDLTNLPNVPENFRIPGPSISLLDFISMVCDAGACDFFTTLDEVTTGNFIIKVHIVSRLEQPTFGLINQFVNNIDGAVIKNAGLELRNDTTSKFLVGGDLTDMFFQIDDIIQQEAKDKLADGDLFGAMEADDAADNTIWQFWGFNADGTPILGKGFNNSHTFVLDSRSIVIPAVGAYYKTDVAEMRAAEDSQNTWEFFLWVNNENEFKQDSDGNDTTEKNPHYQKSEKIGIIGPINKDFATNLDKLKKLTPIELAALSKDQIEKASISLTSKNEENTKKLYEFVRYHADEYYGRQFMVRVPLIKAKKDIDTDEITTSIEPADGGFIEESKFAAAVANKLMPEDFDRVSLPDGRLICYVRFDNAEHLDLSEFHPNDIVFSSKTVKDKKGPEKLEGFDVFIKCSLAPSVLFLDVNNISPTNLNNTRVVIQLPGKVRPRTGDEKFDYKRALAVFLTSQENLGNIVEAFKEFFVTAFGAEQFWFGDLGQALSPTLAAIPLRSNVETYGPWYAVGANGKTEFERNESLVPWNYGGFTAMNAAANAIVTDSLSNSLQFETGVVEFPGVPLHRLGAALLGGGPYVTDISVKVGSDGVTTRYTMKTWTASFGKLAKANADRLKKLAQRAQRQRRANRSLFRQELSPQREALFFNNQRFRSGKKDRQPRVAGHSSNNMICGDVFVPDGEDVRKANVVIQPAHNMVTQLGTNYEKKAGMSLDGLFRPFSTDPNTTDMAHFETPVSGAELPTVSGLNPFASGHDIQSLIRGNELPSNLSIEFGGYDASGISRPMALRGPLVISGWGYDINGDIVSSNKKRSDLWKTGPLDARWDDDRKVWVAGGTNIKLVKIVNDGSFPSGIARNVYKGDVYTISFTDSEGEIATLSANGTSIFAANIRENIILENTFYLATKIGSKYVLDNQATFLEFI